jgi:hypothetical protein
MRNEIEMKCHKKTCEQQEGMKMTRDEKGSNRIKTFQITNNDHPLPIKHNISSTGIV